MRLSTAQIFQQGINNILSQQAQLQKTQQQLATGLRVTTPADDPVAAVQILDISEDLAQLDQFQRNGNLAEGQLALADTTLQDVTGVLQRVRELTVLANNATQTPETRRAIATELEGRLDELVSLANTRDANGEYLFAGFQAQTQPFSRSGGEVVYGGDDGQRFLQVAANTQIAVRDSGRAVFMDIPAGNGRFDIRADAGNSGTAIIDATSADNSYQRDTYSISFSQPTPADPVTFTVTNSSAVVVASGPYESGASITFNGASVNFEGTPADGDSFTIPAAPRQDVFSSVQNIIDSLQASGTGPAASAAVNNAMASGLGNLDQALGRMLEQQADLGVRLNRIDSQRDSNDAFTLQLQETLSDVRDLDVAEAISRLNLQLVALQAAQQSYVRIQGLSLFNFL